MKKPKFSFLFNRLGVSYTISAVIMTLTTITLVIVASSYAYQILERQRGASEFEVAQKSILAFDDALENIAWKPKAARSARFTVDYGQLELIPSDHPAAKTLIVDVEDSNGSHITTYSAPTGFIRYSLRNKYVNFWEGYKSYILGNENLIVTNSTQSFGRVFIEQTSGWVNITLNYRVRAMRTSVITVNGTKVNYVDIWIIKVNIGRWSTNIGNFDLKARCLNVSTNTYGPYPIGNKIEIEVQYGSESSGIEMEDLDPGKVILNFIVAEVGITF
jgi:hypothetical protein